MFHESTGLRNKMLSKTGGTIAGGSLYDVLDLGQIMIYGGTVPATADDVIGGGSTLLVTITNASTATGIKFEDNASGGGLAKKTAEVWSGVVAATGTATFYRHIGAAEKAGTIGAASTLLPRLQGAVGVYGAELNLTNTTLTAAGTQTIDYYYVGLPTL